LLLVLYGILYKQSCNRELLSQYFFGLFPIVYQIPVFIYNYSSLKRHTEHQKDILEKMQMPIEADQFLNKNFALPGIDLLCKKLKLSKREAETAIKLYEGKTYNQIADELFVSLSAIKKHAYNIYRKLDITNKYQLMQKMNEIL
jgi:DNA-binding NarL/FixJ family response regulator